MDTKQRLEDVMRRHNMNRAQMAAYLGVPITTLNGWLGGQRQPGASTLRLLDVLSMIEVMFPKFHDTLIER